MTLASAKPQSDISIRSPKAGMVCNSSLIPTLKHVKLRKCLHMWITSLPMYHTAIGFRWRNCNGSYGISWLGGKILIIDDIPLRIKITVPIVQCISIALIEVTKLSNMTMFLNMCKGHTAHTKVIDSNPSRLKFNQCDILLPLTDKGDHAIYIGDKIF
jgi:hypothetical protein